MVQWVVMAVLTAAVVIALLAPLYRRPARSPGHRNDLAVYRDQLVELEREVERGVIGRAEAEAARAEIGRRLLKAGEAATSPATPSQHRRLAAALIAAVFTPAVAIGFYAVLGSPGVRDQPLSARLEAPVDENDVAGMIAMVEAHLAAAPEDGSGWEVIAPVYSALGRFQDAVRARANALRLLGPSAEREAALGEALTLANEGIVTEEARLAFERALQRDPDALMARFYLAVGLGQEGRNEAAASAWRDLLAAAPAEGAPWVEAARAQLALAEGGARPSMPDAEQLAVIESMVRSLADRLEEEPKDADGWARLVRSYMVLGRQSEAAEALAKAKVVLAGDPERLAKVENAARQAGL
jgi:cytochrome c-type biogenesis protein CcmH